MFDWILNMNMNMICVFKYYLLYLLFITLITYFLSNLTYLFKYEINDII